MVQSEHSLLVSLADWDTSLKEPASQLKGELTSNILRRPQEETSGFILRPTLGEGGSTELAFSMSELQTYLFLTPCHRTLVSNM